MESNKRIGVLTGGGDCPGLNAAIRATTKTAIKEGYEIMIDTIKKLDEKGISFKGVLYGGFMETQNDVYLLEYNARLGDPEAMNVLTLLQEPLLDVSWKIIDGKLSQQSFEKKATVCVYLVPEGYPVDPIRDSVITIDKPEFSELYYASVHEEDGIVKTTGSRSIALLAKGNSVQDARKKVYEDVPNISGDLFYRRDIGVNV